MHEGEGLCSLCHSRLRRSFRASLALSDRLCAESPVWLKLKMWAMVFPPVFPMSCYSLCAIHNNTFIARLRRKLVEKLTETLFWGASPVGYHSTSVLTLNLEYLGSFYLRAHQATMQWSLLIFIQIIYSLTTQFKGGSRGDANIVTILVWGKSIYIDDLKPHIGNR